MIYPSSCYLFYFICKELFKNKENYVHLQEPSESNATARQLISYRCSFSNIITLILKISRKKPQHELKILINIKHALLNWMNIHFNSCNIVFDTIIYKKPNLTQYTTLTLFQLFRSMKHTILTLHINFRNLRFSSS